MILAVILILAAVIVLPIVIGGTGTAPSPLPNPRTRPRLLRRSRPASRPDRSSRPDARLPAPPDEPKSFTEVPDRPQRRQDVGRDGADDVWRSHRSSSTVRRLRRPSPPSCIWPRRASGPQPLPPGDDRGHLRPQCGDPTGTGSAAPATRSASRTLPRTGPTRRARWRWPGRRTRTATAASSSSRTRKPSCRPREAATRSSGRSPRVSTS